jgi:hypothetical protein
MRQLQLSFVNGAKAQLTLHELLSFFRQGRTVAGFLVAGGALVLLGPFNDIAVLPLAEQVVFWGLIAPSAFAVYLGGVIALARWRPVAHTILSHLVTATLLALLAPGFGVWLGADPAIVNMSHRLVVGLFALVWSAAIEFLMVTYLLPGFLDRLSGQALPDMVVPFADAPGSHPEPARVALLGKTYALPDLQLISADEHYVHIHTAQGRAMLRGRISDIEAVLPDAWGRRVHRSHWVAARSVRGLRRGRESWTLLLEDGTEVPVARARRDAVRDWVERLGRA